MRIALLLGLAGCWTGSATPVEPAAPVEQPRAASCNDAALAIDRATRDLRGPDVPVVDKLKARCAEDRWAPPALECFRHMGPDDLGRCTGMLGDDGRDKLFAVLGGGSGNNRTELAMAIARLANLHVGIPECDNFVISVGRILACDEMPISTRVLLGNQTVDFWSLPVGNRLPADAIKRMAAVCDQTRGELEQRAVGAGCKL